MESSPTSPMPFEYGSGDKDKKEEREGKKKSSPLRIPLPASEIHTSEPKKNERILPLFGTKDADPTLQKETTDSTAKPEAPEVELPAEDRRVELDGRLWTEFDDTTPTVIEPSADERAEGQVVAALPQSAVPTVSPPEITIPAPASKAEEQQLQEQTPEPKPETFEDIMGRIDAGGDLQRIHEAVAENEPRHLGWEEHQTIHLNTPPEERIPKTEEKRYEDAIAAAPTAAGMAAEVAATEPDQESVRMWEEFNAAPRAEVPSWHPESQQLGTNEQFQDIMQRADMGEQFIQAVSEDPATTAVPPRTYGSFNSGQTLGGESTPDAPPPSPFPVAEHTNVPHATGSEGPAWYPAPPRYSQPGTGSMLKSVAEAGLAGEALASGAPVFETGGTLVGGAAAGAIAGGVAGHMAGERAGRQEVQRALGQEMNQRDRHISAPTGEQPVTREPAERLHDTENTKVVHSEWVDMAVDKRTGKLVEAEGVNEFGSEYYAEQRPEAEPSDPLAQALAAAQTSAHVTDTYQREHGQNIPNNYGAPPLPSGQIDQPYELQAGQADANHRLPEPRSPVMSAASSPLLWVGVVVLVLAFLVAAFI